MIEVDRVMVEDLGIDLVRMMENAGRALARFVQTYTKAPAGLSVAVLAGSGGNGGGALVAARRLVGWDIDVSVYTSHPIDSHSGAVLEQMAILERLGVETSDNAVSATSKDYTVIVDGLVGYSLSGAPRGRTAEMISWANDQATPTISLDVPSGFSSATESILSPAIVASATLTLALPKRGLEDVPTNTGDLFCADIGVPASLYRDAFGVDIGLLFAESDIVQIADDG